jgi:hypothetical protein
MRKIALMALCFLILGSTAYALDLVIGGGGLFGWNNEEYHYPRTYYDYAATEEVKETAYGGFVFFGLTRFMEASISVHVANNDYVVKWYNDDENRYYEQPGKSYGSQVGVSFYLKYPFTLNILDLYPTLGVDLESQNGTLDLFLGGGLGLDIFFSQKLFLRAQAIYRAGALMIYKGESIDEGTTTTFPAHGPIFKLGLGWMY